MFTIDNPMMHHVITRAQPPDSVRVVGALGSMIDASSTATAGKSPCPRKPDHQPSARRMAR